MKINSLLESQTVSSAISNTTTSAPVFGRDEDRLEETTTSGCMGSVANPVGKVRSRGSIFSGINTSEKFPNSKPVKEENLPVTDKKQKYIQAAKDVLKGADFDHVARVRKLDVEMLRKFVGFAHEKLSKGEYKLNRPNLEEQGIEEATGTLARARDRLGLNVVPLQRSTDNWNDERDARHQSRLSDIERRTRYQDELDKISLDRERHRLARMQKDDDEWNDTFNAMRDRIRHRSNYQFGRENDPRLEQGVTEVGQNFRRGNARRAAINAMSPEEQRAHDLKRQEQQRKRDEARLERERQRNAAKKGVEEGILDTIKSIPQKANAWLDSPIKGMQGKHAGHMASGALAGMAHGHEVGHAMADVGVAEGATPASTSKVLRLIQRHRPDWFDNYGMGEVEDTVVDMAEMGKFQGMSAVDALALVGQELESLYGQQGVAEGNDPYKPEPHDEFASDTYYDNKPGHDTAEDYRAKAQWLMRTHHLRPDEAMEYAYYDTDPATWKGSPWEDDYKQGMSEGPGEVIGLANFAKGGGIPGGQSPADVVDARGVIEEKELNEISPHDFDSDEDYYNAVRKSKQKYHDDDDFDMNDDDDFDPMDDESYYEKYVRTKNLDETGPRAVDDQGNPIVKPKGRTSTEPVEPRKLKTGDSYSTSKGVVTKTDTGIEHKPRSSFTPKPKFVEEEKQRLDPKCWKGYKKQGTKMKGDTRVNNCVKVDEAEISEEMLAHELYKDLQIFKQGKDKTIGKKSKSKDISKKPEDRDIVVKEGTDMKASEILNEGKPGLWANIHAKRERIKHGSGERMRKPGSKGAPSAQDFKDAAKTEAANPAQQAAIAISMKKKGQKPKSEGVDDREYNDEAGMFKNDLQTIQRVSNHLEKAIQDNENLPEWCQAKIAQAKGMIVNVMDYMISQHENGIVDTLEEEFDLIESIVESIAVRNNVNSEAIWEDLESLTDDELYVFAVTSEPINEDWQKVNKKDKTDGMSPKAVKAYRRENPGSKLKTAVTTKPSKLKKGSKASKRRKSYCSRSKGQMNMHNISCSKTPDKAICKARRRWNC